MTVNEVFQFANLSPSGPVPWGTHMPDDPPELRPGVYVVARAGDPTGGCNPCELLLKDHPGIVLDLEYEQKRWLPHEPIAYVGKTDRSIRKRVAEFRRQECGQPGSHYGGQIIKLLQCNLWIYWSPANDPSEAESDMLCAFKRHTGQLPFGNEYQGANHKRIRVTNRSSDSSGTAFEST